MHDSYNNVSIKAYSSKHENTLKSYLYQDNIQYIPDKKI